MGKYKSLDFDVFDYKPYEDDILSKKQNPFSSISVGNPIYDPDELSLTVLGNAELQNDLTNNPFGRGFGEFEDRVPSRTMPGSQFASKPRSFRQDAADIAASTELSRNLELYRSIGLDEAFDQAVKKESDSLGFDTITEDIFDFLSIGNYSTAALVEEYLLTGSPEKALKQAAIEISNSLTLADNFGLQDSVRRTTWGDIFTGKRGETELTFDAAKNNPYIAGAAGFAFDVLLDPTTWFGYGLLKIGKGLGKLDGLAGSLVNKSRLSHTVTQSRAGTEWRKLFVPNGLVKGLKEGENAEELADIVNQLRLEADPQSALVKAEDIRDGAADFLTGLVRKDAAIASQENALRENIVKIAGDMNESELRLVGAFLDQPKVVQGLIDELKVDDNTRQVLKKGVDEWRDMFNRMFEAEQEVGLFDKSQFRANYSNGTEPVTELSKRIVQKMFEVRFGPQVGMKKYNEATKGIVTITDNGVMKSSYAKQYPTLESRLMDAVSTETNVALMAAKRGVESIRKTNTQKFYDTILSDTRIAVPIDQAVATDPNNALNKTLLDHGMKVFKAPALSTRKVARQAAGDEQIYYAMPAAMVDQLDSMNKLITNADESNMFLKTFREVQGLWKAYALMSPGYHARNLYSNVFNNYIAGVNDPKAYAEAMLLQVEDTSNIGNRAVRSTIEKLLGGRKTVEDYMFNLPDGTKKSGADLLEEIRENGIDAGGMIYTESDLGIGRELMTAFEVRSNGRSSQTEIAEGLQNWGNREERIASVASNIYEAAKSAGSDIDAEAAQRTAEMYDVVARAWAWRNWKTPEDWYKSRINQFRAYALPKDGLPDSELDFLFQNRPVGKIDTPEFKKAFEGAYAVNPDGTPIRVFHGTRFTGEINDTGFDVAESGAANYYGAGLYFTEDVSTTVKADDIKVVNNPSPEDGKGINIVSTFYSDRPSQRKIIELEQSINSIEKYSDKNDIIKKYSKSLSDDPEKRRSELQKIYDKEYAVIEKTIDKKIDALRSESSNLSKQIGDIKREKDLKKRQSLEDKLSKLNDRREKIFNDILSLESDKYNVTSYSDRLDNVNYRLEELESIGETPGVFDGYVFIKNPFVISTRSDDGKVIPRIIDVDELDSIVSGLKRMVTRDIQQLGLRKKDPLINYMKTGRSQSTILDDKQASKVVEEFFQDISLDIEEFKDMPNLNDLDGETFYSNISGTLQSLYETIDPSRTYTNNDGKTLFNFFLKDMGYDGLTHADNFLGDAIESGRYNVPKDFSHQVFILFDGKDFKSSRNRGTWDLSDDDMLMQLGDDKVQGAIHFLPNGKADILATAEANETTFIHEMGHLIRRTMLDENDKQVIQRWMFGDKEYQNIYKQARDQAERAAMISPKAMIDVDKLTTELMDRFAWTREGEEFFAKAFEQFVMEGVEYKNMPSPVRGTFDFMKESFQDIYDFSNGGKIGIKANDQVRYALERTLGRGVEPNPEELLTAKAILETAGSEKETIFQRAQRLLGDNYFVKANRAWGERLENNARIAHYIYMRTNDVGKINSNGLLNKKAVGYGMTPEQAAQSVKRYLFDYAELTPFERDYMKTIIPFYTWMRKNIPLQFQEVFRNPERYAPIPKTYNNIEMMSAEWDNIQEPDYFAEMNAVRLPITSGQIPLDGDGMPVYMALDLPFGDLNRLNMKDMVSSMTPFLKTWAEIYPNQGYSFFLDSPIEAYKDEPSFIEVFDKKIDTGLTEKQMHIVNTLLPPLGKAQRLVERAGEGKLGEQLLREVAGINLRSLDPDATRRAELYKRREVSRAFNKRLEAKAKLLGLPEAIEELKN